MLIRARYPNGVILPSLTSSIGSCGAQADTLPLNTSFALGFIPVADGLAAAPVVLPTGTLVFDAKLPDELSSDTSVLSATLSGAPDYNGAYTATVTTATQAADDAVGGADSPVLLSCQFTLFAPGGLTVALWRSERFPLYLDNAVRRASDEPPFPSASAVQTAIDQAAAAQPAPVRQDVTATSGSVTIAAGVTLVALNTSLVGPLSLLLPATTGYALGDAIAIVDSGGYSTTANYVTVAAPSGLYINGTNHGSARVLAGLGAITVRQNGASHWTTGSTPLSVAIDSSKSLLSAFYDRTVLVSGEANRVEVSTANGWMILGPNSVNLTIQTDDTTGTLSVNGTACYAGATNLGWVNLGSTLTVSYDESVIASVALSDFPGPGLTLGGGAVVNVQNGVPFLLPFALLPRAAATLTLSVTLL